MITGIIGAAGYAGAELVRLLSAHPQVEGLSLGSVSMEGDYIENIYPNFYKSISRQLLKPDEVIAGSDLVFASLPHGVGEQYAKACMEKGIHFIDLSADFRFDDDEETFKAWYGKGYVYPELRRNSVYGLPELNREKIKSMAASGPVIIGNPGCYPTSASLGIYPALAKHLAGDLKNPGSSPATIIVDSASGVTGGGREPQKSFHFPECADAVAPYKVGAHRHTPEISRNLAVMAARIAGSDQPASGVVAPGLIFTPHLAPMNRGILSTIYIPLASSWRVAANVGTCSAPRPPSKEIVAKASELRDLYAAFYRNEPFVRVLGEGVFAATNRVRQSNFCDISVHIDQAGTTLIIISALDNMVKGAAGQAIQNMNILMGFEESAGLKAIPALF
ncbi:MAG: N-acetyl-gamma-glutamyl-phosphate reductase [Treponema sp.]|jgi:N-acetyl-gamma-glutamyl-phosphate reductase|nr:N-acetyl-gamma-glutamyl-phosphate reductase [Treponema sp.]